MGPTQGARGCLIPKPEVGLRPRCLPGELGPSSRVSRRGAKTFSAATARVQGPGSWPITPVGCPCVRPKAWETSGTVDLEQNSTNALKGPSSIRPRPVGLEVRAATCESGDRTNYKTNHITFCPDGCLLKNCVHVIRVSNYFFFLLKTTS